MNKHLILYYYYYYFIKKNEDNIHQNSDNPDNAIQYYIYFVPRRTMICERVLEDEGVYGDILLKNADIIILKTFL